VIAPRSAGLSLALLFSCAALAEPGPPISIGQLHTLKSEHLGEERTVLIHLPPGYEAGTQRYPVLYLTDAEAQFGHTAATVDFLAVQGRIPPLIVVAIRNTDRTRDLTPTKGSLRKGEKGGLPPTAGGADRFLAFLGTELVPYVDGQFRTLPYRAFAGHSFGGLLALHALLTRPELFQAVLAVSPTFPWDDDYLLRTARPFFAEKKEARHALFVAIGNEPELVPGFRSLRELARASGADGFEATFREYPDDDHGSLVLAAHHDGLRALFVGWVLARDPQSGFPRGTAGEIAAQYGRLSKTVGFTVVPPERIVNLAGYGRLAERKFPQALAIFEMNAKNYPESANVWDSLGDGLEAAGRLEDARTALLKAVALGGKHGDPLLPAFREHLEKLNARLERAK
jgi:hypothetical protein